MFNNGIEVDLKPDEKNERGNNFQTVVETLTRVGIPNEDENSLTQTCHILFKKGRYYIMHHKEFLELEGKISSYDEEDLEYRDAIARTLAKWGLFDLTVQPERTRSLRTLGIHVVKYSDKKNWNLIQKYKIGKPRE